MAGLKFSQELARLVGCRHIFAEKMLMEAGEGGQRAKEKLALARYEVSPGEQVVIVEELANNFTTTQRLIDLVEAAGGVVIGIVCVINRSFPLQTTFVVGTDQRALPVIAVIEEETPQYRQDDPLVAHLVAAGNVIWQPKKGHWPRLLAAMQQGSR